MSRHERVGLIKCRQNHTMHQLVVKITLYTISKSGVGKHGHYPEYIGVEKESVVNVPVIEKETIVDANKISLTEY